MAVIEIEATNVAVKADTTLDAVVLEVTDQAGDGFRTFFDPVQAMGIAWRIAAAVDRLRGPGVVP